MTVSVITNKNGVVVSWQEVLNKELSYQGVIVESDLDLALIEIVGNYKLVGSTLVELTEEEKIDICPPKSTEQKVEELDKKLTDLQAMYFELLLEV